MAIESLNFGDRLMGHLAVHDAATPFTAATLRMTEDQGVRIEVPYISRGVTEQFTHVDQWFEKQAPPKSLGMYTVDGAASLFRVRWWGHSRRTGRSMSLGTLRPGEVLLGVRDDMPHAEELTIDRVKSRLDALNEWTRLSAFDEQTEVDERELIRGRTYHLIQADDVTWNQGSAALTLRAEWKTEPHQDGYERSVTLRDNVVLESRFEDGPRSFYDHFVEQRKVERLLVFLFDRAIAFREHMVQDPSLTLRWGYDLVTTPYVELISERTVRDRALPTPSARDLDRPMAHLGQIGPDGMATWASNYEKWHRFILPSAGVLERPSAFVEDIILATSMSMEAAGGLIGHRPGEEATYTEKGRRTTATYPYRCLDLLGLTWGPRVESNVGLAQALADMYNHVKHADRGEFPETDRAIIASRITRLVVRLLALHLTGKGDELLAPYRDDDPPWRIQEQFDLRRLRIDHSGKWHSTEDVGDDA